MFEIRAEQPSDISGIGQVTLDAFSHSELGHHGEADLVSAIRAAQPDAISLVAIDAGKIIGHLMSSPAKVESPDRVISGTAIGPVSVASDHQHQGIGSALMNTLIEIASIHGHDFIAVAGHPDFYLRFGFQPLSTFKISHCFKSMRDEVFFLRLLGPVDRTELTGGRLKYCSQFGPQDRFA